MELFDSLTQVLPVKGLSFPVKRCRSEAVKQIPPLEYRIGLPLRITLLRITASDYRIGLPQRITAADYRIGLPHYWFEMASRQVPAMNFTGNSTRWKELIVAEE